VPARVWRETFAGFPEVDYSTELRTLGTPTLLVYGEVYEGVGHALHWEQPERFAQDVAAFSRYCASLPLSR
jgi:pimeloyl-ACP methyl ester carboxylesterase